MEYITPMLKWLDMLYDKVYAQNAHQVFIVLVVLWLLFSLYTLNLGIKKIRMNFNDILWFITVVASWLLFVFLLIVVYVIVYENMGYRVF